MLRANQEETTRLMAAPAINDLESADKRNILEDLHNLQLAIDLLGGKVPPKKSRFGIWSGGVLGVVSLCVDVYSYFVAPSGESEETLKQYSQTALRMLNETIYYLADQGTCGELYPVNNVCHLENNTTIDPTCYHKAERLCDRVKLAQPLYYFFLTIVLLASVALILYSIAKLCRDESKKVTEVLSPEESVILSNALNVINIRLSADITVNGMLKILKNENKLLYTSKQRSVSTLFLDAPTPTQKEYGSVMSQDSVATLRK